MGLARYTTVHVLASYVALQPGTTQWYNQGSVRLQYTPDAEGTKEPSCHVVISLLHVLGSMGDKSPILVDLAHFHMTHLSSPFKKHQLRCEALILDKAHNKQAVASTRPGGTPQTLRMGLCAWHLTYLS